MQRIAGNGGRIGGLLDEIGDHAGAVHRHHAKFAGFHPRNHQTANGDIRARVYMLLKHALIIHLVDMIARQNDHVFGRVAGDDIDILINRVGGAFIPHQF